MAILDKLKKTKEKATPEKKVAEEVKAEAKKEDKVVQAKKTALNVKSDAYKVILKPVITEKANAEEGKGKYTFVVANGANKVQIKNAVKDLYGVMPTNVSTLIVEGKVKRVGRFRGRRSDYKKAVVTLPQGKTISIHEGV
jgi:large subunit ribosomal protein L23